MAGRPKAQRQIVTEFQDIALENWTFIQLSLNLNDTWNTIQWLAARHLLMNQYTCPTCNNLCGLTKRSKLEDHYQWYCHNCVSTKSIRFQSFWSQSHLPLNKLVFMCYMWAYEFPMWIISRELDISQQTLVDWFNFLRDVSVTWLDNNPIEIGGQDDDGNPIIVEIDETACGKREFHKGRKYNTRWVFGGVERLSGRCFAQMVSNRDKPTLLPLIQQHILPGSSIMTDGWSAYADLGTMDGGIYQHGVVVHSDNFVHPIHESIHTQTIEST
jgi:IS1 family transposase/transposase-like protein